MKTSALVLALVSALATPLVLAEPPRTLPVSAHNCYPANSVSTNRVVEALALGIDNIEIDLGWDAAHKKLIVGHDATPRPGQTYPDLEAYLVPAFEAHWRQPRADKAPTVLAIDWKTDNLDAILQFQAFLEAHPDWFSTAPKAAESPLTVRRLTVCFTGSERAKAQFDALIPAGGTYRAFSDKVFGGGQFKKKVEDYAPSPATAYHRFLTFHWGNVEAGGPPLASAWTDEDIARLSALMRHVHRQGFRARFYCLNGHIGPALSSYRFQDDDSARIRWQAAANAGVDWIATDEYSAIAQALSGR
ncbi:hypothetical protein V5E97_39250 [Singulisphaera sp. Ch08]|uniref:Glycerophosphodiester phosphodiesterase n=1 Tax=Singulisphaera sp. Ch08 TaxID=3120278 RepID=A0AAU7CG98_9BACT